MQGLHSTDSSVFQENNIDQDFVVVFFFFFYFYLIFTFNTSATLGANLNRKRKAFRERKAKVTVRRSPFLSIAFFLAPDCYCWKIVRKAGSETSQKNNVECLAHILMIFKVSACSCTSKWSLFFVLFIWNNSIITLRNCFQNKTSLWTWKNHLSIDLLKKKTTRKAAAHKSAVVLASQVGWLDKSDASPFSHATFFLGQ